MSGRMVEDIAAGKPAASKPAAKATSGKARDAFPGFSRPHSPP